MKVSILFVCLFIVSLTMGSDKMDEYQGLKIDVDPSDFKESGEVKINGEFSIFVNCGSQYSTWFQFPATIQYTLKDLDTGDIFKSMDNELSISWDGNEIYDHYAKEPCNRIITKGFSTTLTEIYFENPSKKPITNFELNASYLGHTSNSLTINNVSVVLNNF
jgi:hypothetical protein